MNHLRFYSKGIFCFCMVLVSFVVTDIFSSGKSEKNGVLSLLSTDTVYADDVFSGGDAGGGCGATSASGVSASSAGATGSSGDGSGGGSACGDGSGACGACI